MSKTFLYRTKAADDRDCCAYIEPSHFECGHYFSGLRIGGACYSDGGFANYEDIDTFLSEEDYNKLIQFENDITELGYGITKGDDRYNKGMKLCAEIQPIFDKLNSVEGTEFAEEIFESEAEYIQEEYGLSYDEVMEVYHNYAGDYQDRAIIGYVYQDSSDLGYAEMENYFAEYKMPDNLMNYFDYERFGEDLVNESEFYLELLSGTVVYLNY